MSQTAHERLRSQKARERLQPIIDWVNDVIEKGYRKVDWTEAHGYALPPMPTRTVRKRLRDFVEGFDDGALRIGHVNFGVEQWPARFHLHAASGDVETQRLGEVRFYLQFLFTVHETMTLPSLTFALDREAGRQTMVVSGTLPDVVLYLAMHLATRVTIGICPAPAPSFPGVRNDWQQTCGKLFVIGGPGQPQKWCDPKGNCHKRFARMQEALAKAGAAPQASKR